MYLFFFFQTSAQQSICDGCCGTRVNHNSSTDSIRPSTRTLGGGPGVSIDWPDMIYQQDCKQTSTCWHRLLWQDEPGSSDGEKLKKQWRPSLWSPLTWSSYISGNDDGAAGHCFLWCTSSTLFLPAPLIWNLVLRLRRASLCDITRRRTSL